MKLNDIESLVLVWGAISEAVLGQLKKEASLILVPENRPFLLGLKHNIPLLERENIDYLYCTDNMLGLFFYKGKIRKTLIFYKEAREKIIGFCGTMYVSLLSKLHHVDIQYVRQDKLSFNFSDKDASTLGGKNFILEENKQTYIIEPYNELVDEEALR